MQTLSRRAFATRFASATAAIALRTLAQGNANIWTAAIIGHTGAGDYGHGLDLIFKDLPNVKVVAVADANAEGREKAKQRISAVKAYADYREMLAAEKPQLVCVAPRWTKEHYAMVKAALDAGAHVFCEKPFTMTLRESDELLALAENKNLRIAVSHQMRMSPNVVALKHKLSDTIGELVQMRA